MKCFYKKTFLKDLSSIPAVYQKRIEKLVFKEIPDSKNITDINDLKKMRGYNKYFRIRIGNYRIGCMVGTKDNIIFYRVKSRKDIYKLFP